MTNGGRTALPEMCESRLQNVSARQLDTLSWVLLAMAGVGLLFAIGLVITR